MASRSLHDREAARLSVGSFAAINARPRGETLSSSVSLAPYALVAAIVVALCSRVLPVLQERIFARFVGANNQVIFVQTLVRQADVVHLLCPVYQLNSAVVTTRNVPQYVVNFQHMCDARCLDAHSDSPLFVYNSYKHY